jgi:hypothetical protein
MSREEFLAKAKKHGHDPKRNKKMNATGRNNFRQELLDYFKSPQGQEDISYAPVWLREKSVEEIVELLLQEV